MSHAGAVGELIVARIRLMLTVALLIVPIVMMAIEPWDEHYIAGLVILVSAVGIAFGVFVLVRRGFTSPWLGAESTGLDVSLVSAALVTFLILEGATAAVNSRVVFECYFIAIGVTCLRYDLRLCLFAGALAMLQYFAMALWSDLNWDMQAAIYRPNDYGIFDWGAQISRLVLLGTASLLAATVVGRGQALRRLQAREPSGTTSRCPVRQSGAFAASPPARATTLVRPSSKSKYSTEKPSSCSMAPA
jgi:hypothetical protein